MHKKLTFQISHYLCLTYFLYGLAAPFLAMLTAGSTFVKKYDENNFNNANLGFEGLLEIISREF